MASRAEAVLLLLLGVEADCIALSLVEHFLHLEVGLDF